MPWHAGRKNRCGFVKELCFLKAGAIKLKPHFGIRYSTCLLTAFWESLGAFCNSILGILRDRNNQWRIQSANGTQNEHSLGLAWLLTPLYGFWGVKCKENLYFSTYLETHINGLIIFYVFYVYLLNILIQYILITLYFIFK